MKFIHFQVSDNSLVPGFTYQLITRCLKDAVSKIIEKRVHFFNENVFIFKDDTAVNHAACKIIENLLLVADKQADKLATSDVALALWNIASTVGNNEHIRASALAVI